MKMKNMISLFLALALLLTGTACSVSTSPESAPSASQPQQAVEPTVAQMRSICELAVMECYYHNVAKVKEEDVEGILWWKKDLHFWIEYSGVVRLGIDASLVSMELRDTRVTVTIPEAKVLSCTVDSASLSKDSYIVDKDSADIKAEDEVSAFDEAQRQMEAYAAQDQALLAQAQQQAQALLEDYINNIGQAVGKQYTVEWVYLPAQEAAASASSGQAASQQASSAAASAG